MLLAPDLRSCFHLLHTGLGILVNGFIVAVSILCRGRLRLGTEGGVIYAAIGLDVLKADVAAAVDGCFCLWRGMFGLAPEPGEEVFHRGVLAASVLRGSNAGGCGEVLVSAAGKCEEVKWVRR